MIVTDDVLSERVEAIVREIDPERIYLFGSRARGDERPDSDVDLLVVERDTFGPGNNRFHRINRILEALPKRQLPTDILLYSSDEFLKMKDSLNHVIGRCQREGRLLYARS